MNPRSCLCRLALRLLAVWVLVLGGCADVFIPKTRVLIDAISVPGGVKNDTKSYKLLARRSVVMNQQQVDVSVVSACVKAALNQKGMFEAPDKVAPDYFIEVTYGTDNAPRVDPMARESYLQLSARANPNRAVDHARGPEVWDVRAAVQGLRGRIESAMPMLATTAAAYAGTDTHQEVLVPVPQNSPAVASVRETAVKELEAKRAGDSPGGNPAR